MPELVVQMGSLIDSGVFSLEIVFRTCLGISFL